MTKKYRSSGLLVSRPTRWVIYKPLAAVLAVLLIPTFSLFESTAGIPLGATAKSLEASAQIISGCGTPRGNTIIQEVCVNGVVYGPDLDQLEVDAILAYIKQHDLTILDAQPAIYDIGRADWRSAIRAEMLGILTGIINKPANARSDHEKRLYAWFETLVKQNEIAEYTLALQEYRRFQLDPCSFTLDRDTANQYGLAYNGPALCAPATTIAVGPPFVPAASYFTAFGIKNSCGKSAKDHPNFAKLVARTQINLGEMNGIASALGAVADVAGMPAHRPTDPVFMITPQSANPTASDSFTYDDWGGVAWRAETFGRWFKQTCLGDSFGQNCRQANSFIASIECVDGSGVKLCGGRDPTQVSGQCLLDAAQPPAGVHQQQHHPLYLARAAAADSGAIL